MLSVAFESRGTTLPPRCRRAVRDEHSFPQWLQTTWGERARLRVVVGARFGGLPIVNLHLNTNKRTQNKRRDHESWQCWMFCWKCSARSIWDIGDKSGRWHRIKGWVKDRVQFQLELPQLPSLSQTKSFSALLSTQHAPQIYQSYSWAKDSCSQTPSTSEKAWSSFEENQQLCWWHWNLRKWGWRFVSCNVQQCPLVFNLYAQW